MYKKAVILFVLILTLTGCSKSREAESEVLNNSGDGVGMEDLANVMQSGGSAMCTVEKTDGSETMTYYIKGEKVKMTGIVSDETGTSSMISDTEYVYTWNDASGEGVKFPIIEQTDLETDYDDMPVVPDFTDDSEKDEYIEQGYEVNCREENVSDAEFVPPANVIFADMSQMLQEAQNIMQQIPDQDGQDIDPAQQEQIDKLMQQFGQ